MAGGTVGGAVGPLEGEAGQDVVERASRGPGGFVVAAPAGGGEARRHMVGIDGLLEVGLVARSAVSFDLRGLHVQAHVAGPTLETPVPPSLERERRFVVGEGEGILQGRPATGSVAGAALEPQLAMGILRRRFSESRSRPEKAESEEESVRSHRATPSRPVPSPPWPIETRPGAAPTRRVGRRRP